MYNITYLCKRYHKKPSHFLDNSATDGHRIDQKKGRNGYTKIPEDLMFEFFLWLSKDSKNMLINKGLAQTFEYYRGYMK